MDQPQNMIANLQKTWKLRERPLIYQVKGEASEEKSYVTIGKWLPAVDCIKAQPQRTALV